MQTRIKSRAGVAASVIFLLLLPAAVLYQAFFASGVEIFIHLVFAAGFIMLALAVSDFETPVWIKWPARLAAGLFAIIVLIQALSLALTSKTLHNFAFNILGQAVEAIAGSMVLLWFVAVLRYDSSGKTRIFGTIAAALSIGTRLFQYTPLFYVSDPTVEALKLFLLLPFAWLLLESRKRLIRVP